MMDHTVYDVCKSRELITALNRIGACVSYNEIKRARSNLAQHALHQSDKVGVPMPSHFVQTSFTIAAIDNFDHRDRSSPSGTKSNHDTVMTLFQTKASEPSSKPSKSAIHWKHSDSSALKCQQIKHFIPQKDNLPLDSFIVSNDLFRAEEKSSRNSDVSFITRCLRGGFLDCESPESLPTWAGCRAFLSQSEVPLMNVGFLPYIPHPVTAYSTVYTALHNSMSVLAQLNHRSMSIFCDEGRMSIALSLTSTFSVEMSSRAWYLCLEVFIWQKPWNIV